MGEDVPHGGLDGFEANPVRGHDKGGMRPIVVLSHEVFNKHSGTVIALAISSQPQSAGFPLSLELNIPLLPKQSWVKISQIRTLSTARLGKRIARLSPELIERLIDGLSEITGE